jgi:hypothetical protein
MSCGTSWRSHSPLTLPELPIAWAGLWDDVHAALARAARQPPLIVEYFIVRLTSYMSNLDNFTLDERRYMLHARRRHDPG